MDKHIKLTDAEWKVMTLLWEYNPRTMMQLTKALKNETNWEKHTVMTFLRRLEIKGALHYEQGLRAKLYYPDVKRDEAALYETRDFLDKVYFGRVSAMLNTMVRQKALKAEEIQELREILDTAEQQL